MINSAGLKGMKRDGIIVPMIAPAWCKKHGEQRNRFMKVRVHFNRGRVCVYTTMCPVCVTEKQSQRLPFMQFKLPSQLAVENELKSSGAKPNPVDSLMFAHQDGVVKLNKPLDSNVFFEQLKTAWSACTFDRAEIFKFVDKTPRHGESDCHTCEACQAGICVRLDDNEADFICQPLQDESQKRFALASLGLKKWTCVHEGCTNGFSINCSHQKCALHCTSNACFFHNTFGLVKNK